MIESVVLSSILSWIWILCRIGGPRKLKHAWSQDQKLFEAWRDGTTGSVCFCQVSPLHISFGMNGMPFKKQSALFEKVYAHVILANF